MRYALSRTSRTVLEQLSRERTLCAFDFDGTLAPIVEHPDQATLAASTRHWLGRLAALYPCVILSGRARGDLLPKLQGMQVARVFGNHGAEGEESVRQGGGRVRRWKAALEVALGPMPGVWVEEKGRSLAVHYRQSTRKLEVKRKIFDAARRLERARVFGGKYVVNVVVDGDPHKGTALAAERDRLKCEAVLYVGDDQNDEEAFAIDGRTVSVRIGRSARSSAKYYLRDQSEIDLLLQLLVTLRQSPPYNEDTDA
jgi:trehalose 6-phosphate phosphatase